MSWSGRTEIPKGKSVEEIRQAVNEIAVTGNDDAAAERDAQVRIAKRHAVSLIESGAVGEPGKIGVGAAISGHASPGHQGNDSVYVSIWRNG